MDLVAEKVRFLPSNLHAIDARQRSYILDALMFIPSGVSRGRQCAYEAHLLCSILRNMGHPSDHVVVTHGLHHEQCPSGMRLYFDIKLVSKNYPADQTIHVYVDVVHIPIMQNTSIPGVEIMHNAAIVLHRCSYEPQLRVLYFSIWPVRRLITSLTLSILVISTDTSSWYQTC